MTVPTINQGSMPLATPGADLYSPIIGANVVKGNQVQAQTIILAQSGVASSVTGTITPTTLASITIPGGMVGANGIIEIDALFSCTNNANAKSVLVSFGGTGLATLNMVSSLAYNALLKIRNLNSLASQTTHNSAASPFGASTSGFSNSAVNTASDATITFAATLGNSADTITLVGYTVRISPNA